MSTVRLPRHSITAHQTAPQPDWPPQPDPGRGPRRRRKTPLVLAACTVVLGVLAGGAYRFQGPWLPELRHLIAATSAEPEASDPDGHDHAADEHADEPTAEAHAGEDAAAEDDHLAEDNATSLELSPQGRKNIGLTLVTIVPRDFQRTISTPAVLVDRPGRTQIAVSAPMTGIVARIHPIRGEAVAPGSPLFELRLTHEDLVEKQSELLRAVEELDVVKQEVARLEEVTASGAVAGKRLLERQYEQQKMEAVLRAQRQALVLHGLGDEQVERIVRDRQLLQSLSIVAPSTADAGSCAAHEEFLQVADLAVQPGEHVAAGARLCTLTDHCELYIEGQAFAQDAPALNQVANGGLAVTALVDDDGSGKHEVAGLRILYVENEVGMDSRALKFYVRLPNELVRNEVTADGRRFVGWRYRPGQRVEVLVPVERWERRIVLPVEAVIREGADWFVYRQEGDRFERTGVHVEYRDPRWAVIDNDGDLAEGDVVAATGAYQIHLALKNRSGGGLDPHAGHGH